MARIQRKAKKTAKKSPRYPNYKKRAAASHKAERLINKTIFKMTDEQIRRVHGDENQQKKFIEDVEYGIQQTRPTKQFIEQNPNIMIMIGKEAAHDRK